MKILAFCFLVIGLSMILFSIYNEKQHNEKLRKAYFEARDLFKKGIGR